MLSIAVSNVRKNVTKWDALFDLELSFGEGRLIQVNNCGVERMGNKIMLRLPTKIFGGAVTQMNWFDDQTWGDICRYVEGYFREDGACGSQKN